MRQLVLLLFIFISGATEALGQTGTVAGVTFDSEKRPIAGVLVVLSDDRFFAKSDGLGRFEMLNVPTGSYQVYAVDRAHLPRIVKNVRVESGKAVLLQIKLYDWASLQEHRFNELYQMPLFVPDSSIQYR
ncbi:MAG: carboxypeptidase regulatory-like domain-containing protein [Rhodospirillales bacterium]|nr:carboxypeptidase regulatory-like domain-containing protein [Rhodospirillales bacterium]